MVLGVVGKGVLFREVSSVGGVRIQRFHCTVYINHHYPRFTMVETAVVGGRQVSVWKMKELDS